MTHRTTSAFALAAALLVSAAAEAQQRVLRYNADYDPIPLAAMQAVEPRITDEVFAVLSVERSVRSRTSFGGTAPANVRAQARKWLKRLEKGR